MFLVILSSFIIHQMIYQPRLRTAIRGTKMSDQGIDDETRDSIIEALHQGDKTQTEIADDNGVSQSTVSNINRGLSTGIEKGREEGKSEGYAEAVEEALSFDEADQTEADDDDTYTCGYCEDEGVDDVTVQYLQEECPNGHDLAGDW